MLDYDKPPREAKFNYGEAVCYWDNIKERVVEGKIAFTFMNHYNSEFDNYTYVVETKDDQIQYGLDGSDVHKKPQHTEESLFRTKLECLKAEYEKEKEENNRIKNELEDSDAKLEILKFFIDIE